MFASEWYHPFMPEGSSVVVVTLIVLLAIAFISGVKSVKVRPRRICNNIKNYEGEPRFVSSKAKVVKEDVKYVLRFCKREIADSTIVMCSKTVDVLLAIMAGVVFGYVFCAEHWYGIVQAAINILSPTDGAAWGDIMAYFVVFFFSVGAAEGFYVVREYAQYRRAKSLFREYIFKLKKRPILVEKPDIIFVAIHTAWAIKSVIADLKVEYKAKKAQSKISVKKTTKVIEFPKAI